MVDAGVVDFACYAGAVMGNKETIEELKAGIWPVDRTNRALVGGKPETPDHREINPATGLQKAYVVLSEAERARGFVRPVRDAYRHLTCRAGWRGW